MEEDVKIIKASKIMSDEIEHSEHSKRLRKAIENLIKGYRDSEDIMKKTVKENLELKEYIRELEKERDGIYADYQDLGKEKLELEQEYDKLAKHFVDNHIATSKIKEKMKKYEWALESYDCDIADYKQSQDIGSWHALQELMEDK